MADYKKEDRPTILGGLTIKVQTGCGNLYTQLNWCHGRLFEVFATLGKSGGCASCHTEATTRLVTSALRSGIPVDECVDQLLGLRCPSPVMFPKDHRALSCPDAIANTMIKYGKLSIQEVINLILKANNIEVSPGTEADIKEAREAEVALAKLQEQREKDGLYGKLVDKGLAKIKEGAHNDDTLVSDAETSDRESVQGSHVNEEEPEAHR